MSETKCERYIRILSGLGGADISSEACKELVELLKEQPETAAQTAESAQNVSNEDLISRKAAIDAIYHHLPSVSRTRARTMLHEVPSAQPEQQWIPCSERLPRTNGVYNVTRKISDGFECRNISDACYFDGINMWHDDTRVNHGRMYLTDVIAWMPLPESWEGKE